jgi:hypothetical protein
MAHVHQFSHIEIDRFPDGDGIDIEALRPEWNAFWNRCEATPLSQVLAGRASVGAYAGAILTFPSGVAPTPSHFDTALCAGMTPVILYGAAKDCLRAFLAREKSTSRGLNEAHWALNNGVSYPMFGAAQLAQYRIEVFEHGTFRDASAIAEEVRKRAG